MSPRPGFVLVLVLVLASGLLASAADAAAEPPRRELWETFGAQVNVPGIENWLDLSWRWPLSRSPKVLLKDAHLRVGLTHAVTPAFNRLGAWVEVSPLSVLDLRAGVEPAVYHGLFGHLLGYESRTEPFDATSRRALEERAAVRTGGRAYVAPTLKARAGPIVASVGAEIEWWRASAPERFFYEPERDTLLLSDGDRLVRTDVVVGHETTRPAGRRLILGLSHRWMAVRGAPALRMERPGLLAAWTLGDRRFGVGEPTLAGILFYYRQDPFKEGELGLNAGVRFRLGR